MSNDMFNTLKNCLTYEGNIKSLKEALIKNSEHSKTFGKLLLDIEEYFSQTNSHILELEFTKERNVKVLTEHVLGKALNKKLLKGSIIFIFERY